MQLGDHIVMCKILNFDGVRRLHGMGKRFLSPQLIEELRMFVKDSTKRKGVRVTARDDDCPTVGVSPGNCVVSRAPAQQTSWTNPLRLITDKSVLVTLSISKSSPI